MSMTEIVSFLDLSVFPSVALVFFLAAFIAILWKTLTKSKQEIDAAANIPLDDDVVFTPRVSIQSNNAAPAADKGATHA
jgi:cbb3-type cytochrome oxidase subunit 3